MPDFGSPIQRPNFVSSGWFDPREYRKGVHEGLDFPAPIGTPVLAIGDGTIVVAHSADDTNAGRFLAVAHPDGWTSFYMHLDKLVAKEGQRIGKGALIGRSGRTGIRESAPHLHFHLKVKDVARYTSLFGTPTTGFGRTDRHGTTVPAEPLIPVDRYRPSVVQQAALHQVPLYRSSGLLGWLVLGGVAWWAWRELA